MTDTGLRVLHVLTSTGSQMGGPASAIAVLAPALARAGCRVRVVSTSREAAQGRSAMVPAMQGSQVGTVLKRDTGFYAYSRSLSRWLRTHVGDHDVVHVHGLFSFPPTHAARLARRRGIPYIVRPFGTLDAWSLRERRPLLKRISLALVERRLLGDAAAVHVASDIEADEVARFVDRSRIHVIPNAVAAGSSGSADRFRDRYPAAAGKRVIASISRLHPKKGLELLFESLSLLPAEGWVAAIAGEGDAAYEGSLRAAAERSGVADRVLWLGPIGGDAKDDLLAAADVFVAPSHDENFGTAVAEAMAAGVPVVVSDRVGLHTVVGDHHAGCVVPLDAGELAGALQRLMDDPEERAHMGSAGAQIARELFEPNDVARAVLAMYQGVTRG